MTTCPTCPADLDDTPICDWSDLPTATCHHCPTTAREHALHTHPLPPLPAPGDYHVAHPVAVQTAPPATTPNPVPHLRAIDRDQPGDLHDYVVALTETTYHLQPYSIPQRNTDGTTTWVTERHRTTVPPLLEQLVSAIYSTAALEGARAGYESKPSASVDAIDTYEWIEREAVRWLHTLQLKVPYRPTRTGQTVDVPTAVRRAAANSGDRMLRDVRDWWSVARTVTGWDSPSWRPTNTCPICSEKGCLRIRLDAGSAYCAECRATWDHATIGLLADHIRYESEHQDETSTEQAG